MFYPVIRCTVPHSLLFNEIATEHLCNDLNVVSICRIVVRVVKVHDCFADLHYDRVPLRRFNSFRDDCGVGLADGRERRLVSGHLAGLALSCFSGAFLDIAFRCMVDSHPTMVIYDLVCLVNH